MTNFRPQSMEILEYTQRGNSPPAQVVHEWDSAVPLFPNKVGHFKEQHIFCFIPTFQFSLFPFWSGNKWDEILSHRVPPLCGIEISMPWSLQISASRNMQTNIKLSHQIRNATASQNLMIIINITFRHNYHPYLCKQLLRCVPVKLRIIHSFLFDGKFSK